MRDRFHWGNTAGYIFMNDFYLVYQPKVRAKKIIAVEALLRPYQTDMGSYFRNLKDTLSLDKKVLLEYHREFTEHNLVYPVSLNVHPTSLLNEEFIELCLAKLSNRMITLELIETQNIKVSEQLKKNTSRLQSHNIKISIDDFCFEYTRLDLAIEVKTDEIKFDGSLIRDIEHSFFKFKYLITLYSRFRNLGIRNIVFEQVETKRQYDLINYFCQNAIIQGYYFYKPMRMVDLLLEDLTICESYNKDNRGCLSVFQNLDYFVYRHMISHDDYSKKTINETIKEYDHLGTVYNCDENLSIKNLKNIYFSSEDIANNSVMSLLHNTDKLIVIRNDDGVVIYDNIVHRDLIGRSLIGIDANSIIKENESYKECLKTDNNLFSTNQGFLTSKEVFNNSAYGVIREKMLYNDRAFAIVTMSEPDADITLSILDPLTQCYTRAYLSQKLTNFHGKILAFIDLNGFKSINDNIGHDVGDRCLVDFVSLLKSTLRDNDTVVRYGGDEFVILFDSASLTNIAIRLHEINDIVISYFENKSITLSFSFGLSLLDQENIEISIKEADSQMYKSKKIYKQSLTIDYTI